jgi:hypothetical protein
MNNIFDTVVDVSVININNSESQVARLMNEINVLNNYIIELKQNIESKK